MLIYNNKEIIILHWLLVFHPFWPKNGLLPFIINRHLSSLNNNILLQIFERTGSSIACIREFIVIH